MNTRQIKVYNIFNHSSFREEVINLKKKKLPKEEFAKKLERKVLYHFWSKFEYEVVVTSFPPYIDKKELDRLNSEYESFNTMYGHYPLRIDVCPETYEKIDIYQQVHLNWDVFVNYVWRAKI
jgi:hypothetical protein